MYHNGMCVNPRLLLCSASVIALTLSYDVAYANPRGGVVSAGSATITESGAKIDIHQHTGKAVIDWRGFDIGVGEHTQFHQPSNNATALNRVNSPDPSHIAGKLSANGNVILVNPNGVFFDSTSQVDVNSLIATTANIDNGDFMKGELTFDQPGNPDASIVNAGTITAKEAGLVGLVAPHVENHGVINARLGTVHLASGDTVTVDMSGRNLYELAVSDDVASQLVVNTGSITAEGGTIAFTAAAGRDIVNSLVHVEGELRAPSVKQQGGKIIIAAEGSNAVQDNRAELKDIKDGASTITMRNVLLDVSGREANVQGGQIDVTADHIGLFAGTIMDASGSAPTPVLKPEAPTETSTLTADKRAKTEAKFLASENRGGGSIKIGGDYLGTGTTAAAQAVYVDPDTLIANEGIAHGDGGRTIIWADGDTAFHGNVFGRGGSESGHGGFLETSGKRYLDAQGYADLTASDGYQRGLYLLDPTNITIYGNVDPEFVSTDGSTNLNGDLQLWLDASDASTVQLTYSTDGVATTANGTVGTTTITTAADVSANLKVGSRIRLGAAGAVTTATTLGTDTYTITAIAGTTITVAETLTSTYAGSNVHRGLVSQWADKSDNAYNAAQAIAANMPLWLDNQLNSQDIINFDGFRTLTLGSDYIFSTNNGLSAFTTATPSATGNQRFWFDFGSFGNTGYGFNLSSNVAALYTPLSHGGFGSSNHAHTLGANPIINSNLITFNSTQRIILNGTEINSDNIPALNQLTAAEINEGNPAASGVGPVTIGSQSKTFNQSTRDFEGTIGDTIIYDVALSDDARHLVEQYQSAKWGVELTGVGTGANEAARATAADGYSVFTTRYLERLSSTADVSLLADNNITLDLKGDTLNLANNRSLTLTTTNQDILDLSAGTIQTSGTGNITLNSGRDIILDNGIAMTAQGTGNLTIRAADTINLDSATLTTNGGFITTWSDSNNDNDGAQDLQNSTITTNGGHFFATGGLDDGANGGVAADGIADNNAWGDNTDVIGIRLLNTDISTATGNITLRGKGRDIGAGNFWHGTQVRMGSVLSTTSGDIALYGTGGDAGRGNYGISVFEAGTEIETDDGAITLNGTGGNGADSLNIGINIEAGADIYAHNNGSISIDGTGGNVVGFDRHYGVRIGRATGDVSIISSNNGNLSIEGQGGIGQSKNSGIDILDASLVQSQGTGNIILNATAGNSTGTENHGLLMNGGAIETLAGGAITITAQGVNDSDIKTATNMTTLGSATASGNIALNANSVELDITNTDIRTTGSVTIAPRTAGTAINLGNAAGGLDLTQAELDTIKSAAQITIGDTTNTGTLTVSDAIDMSALSSDLLLIGDTIALSDSLTANAANTVSVTADNGNISHVGGAITANSINLDATGTITADIVASNVDIGNNATATTLTGTMAGAQTQAAADLITGGPGNNTNYTFAGFTIRLAPPSSGGGSSTTPTLPITPESDAVGGTPVTEPEVDSVKPIPTSIPETPVISPAPSQEPVTIPATVEITSQEGNIQNNSTSDIVNSISSTRQNNNVPKRVIVLGNDLSQTPSKSEVLIHPDVVKQFGVTEEDL